MLHAFREVRLTGVALAPLGVAVVVGRGVSVAKAALQLKKERTTSAAVILIRDLQCGRWMVQAIACNRGHTLDAKAFRRHEERIKNPSLEGRAAAQAAAAQASLSRSICAYAEWLWIDSKFSDSTL